jgi:hypothetical protein
MTSFGQALKKLSCQFKQIDLDLFYMIGVVFLTGKLLDYSTGHLIIG